MRILLFTDEPVLLHGYRRVFTDAGIDMIAPVTPEAPVPADETAGLALLAFRAINAGMLRRLHASMPECKLVIAIRNATVELAARALDMGVRGIVSATMPPEDLVSVIRRVEAGEVHFQFFAGSQDAVHSSAELTRREQQIVSLLEQGFKNKEIATVMNVTEGSVKTYLFRLFHKLGVKNRFELAKIGFGASGRLQDPMNSADEPESTQPKKIDNEGMTWKDVNIHAGILASPAR